MLCLTALLLTSCGSIGQDSACVAFNPIIVGQEDEVSDATARQILGHNRVYTALCGHRTR